MQVRVGSTPVTLAKELVIGQGGEAVIYKDPTSPEQFGLKIYREPDPKRAQKLEAMLKAHLVLPQSAIIPLAPVRSARGELIGFRMQRLTSRYRKLGLTFSESFSRDHGFTSVVKADLLAKMAGDLGEFHSNNIVIGDLNDGNEMVDEVGKGLAWIDMDSVQFGAFPCMAGTQLYLSPEFYGADLSQGVRFRPEHDWYSYSIILTRTLTNGVHPFKSGLHKKYLSVFDRAEHGATVFDADVSYPGVGLPSEVLGDELLGVLQKMLKRQTRGPFPLEALDHYKKTLIECSSCGLYYPAQCRKCPSCAQTTTLDAKAAAALAGFTVATLFETKGRVLYLARGGTRIFAVVLEGSNLFLCTAQAGEAAQRTPLHYDIPRSAWFGTFGGSFVVCPDPSSEQPELYVLDVEDKVARLRKRLTTETFSGAQAVFATSDKYLYRIAGRQLLCGERFGSSDMLERPVMQVFEGQTWFTAARNLGDQEILAGFHREFGELHWFLVRGAGDGRSFTRLDSIAVTPLESRESMTDHAVYFSRESVMVVRATRKRGVDRVRVDVVSTTDGASLQASILEGQDIGPWERVHGKAYSNGLVMHPSDQGILRESLAGRSRQSLVFTENHVRSTNGLDRLGGGIMVVKDDRVLTINP